MRGGLNSSQGSPIPETELKVFNDPIHGHIELHPLLVKIIDTVQFQRLRNIKQLGGCYYVYPGASHNRFEHSIGVCHLAGELAQTLRNRQPELDISETDVLCVQIAGLCHDLGHGPFSHLFDQMFMPKANPARKDWKHEQASIAMFNHLVEQNDLIDVFRTYDLGEDDVTFIKEQINGPLASHKSNQGDAGEWPYKGRGEDKSFLYEIVANKRNGIDVDKWDYFARDSYHLGIKQSFDHIRFMTFVRVLDVNGEKQICPRDKECHNLYEMFHTRSALHRRAYQHKTTKVIELMLTEALILANAHLKFQASDGSLLKMSDSIDDMSVYEQLSDTVFDRIQWSDDPDLQPARSLLDRVQTRELYKYVAQTQIDDGTLTKYNNKREGGLDIETLIKDILNCLKKLKNSPKRSETEDELVELTREDLRLQMTVYNYGMKNQNPMDNVRFYSKSQPDQAIVIRKEEVSQMLPKQFEEHVVRLFCVEACPDKVETAKAAFKAWCIEHNFKKPTGGELPPDMTPLKPELKPELKPASKRSAEQHGETSSSAAKSIRF